MTKELSFQFHMISFILSLNFSNEFKVKVNFFETVFGSLSKSKTVNGIRLNYISFDAQECGDSNHIKIIDKYGKMILSRQIHCLNVPPSKATLYLRVCGNKI